MEEVSAAVDDGEDDDEDDETISSFSLDAIVGAVYFFSFNGISSDGFSLGVSLESVFRGW